LAWCQPVVEENALMSTLNVSMPDPMREYIEQQAERGQYSASEYVRHLIREDQKRKAEAERDMLREYLLLCAKQLDDGEFEEVTVEGLMAEGDARRAKEGKSAA
jgi:antitoxin ParD1/3/4